MADLEKKVAELASQVQSLQEQFDALRAKFFFMEFLFLFLLVGVVGIFLWRRVRDYQALKVKWSRLFEQIFRVAKWSLCQG